ncbi:MAG: biopolymer transporter ExbD [Pseudomonadota bacterium]
MINVVFLLLIFFLISAQIAPPEPFEVLLPDADEEELAEAQGALYLSAEGELAFRDLREDEAIEAARADMEERGARHLELRADAGVEGAMVAALLARLAAAGIADVALVTAVQ